MEKFADEALIEVSSGSGGNGCVAFRREKYVPNGGPSGGDGGRGGDVVFQIRRNLRTLAHLRYKQSFKAENGRDGEGRGRYGRNGEDIFIPLPPGTLIKDADSDELIKDFGKDTNDFTFLKGGNGGWGNIHFKSSVNQAPRKALPGKAGEKRRLKVELQVMADIGLVGFPNAGKSSLLDRFTNARPRIASYPFTTKIPNLGVLSLGDQDIIIADIPGLIEGASEGLGLGIRFLKHISRTVALAFLVDLGEDNYLEAFDVLLSELDAFSPELTAKKRILIGSKLDREEAAGRLEEFKKKYPNEDVLGISVFSGEGIPELAALFGRLVGGDPAK
ncbi:GTPase ObgE [Leadbettera azotonutricia]|uniref:GTPase Obg n=1 Tax=Leadbettera azotonutricia (strain ATCC BAA-888 / DSM 13862 / ZAS-9) TaxID=545695 RepID=F5Y7D6_LEAAZ|nr:GTPase ObgE [Leadbettera azotonutricia]AEF80859.1 Obg family GTPase CgtA [Leadbettera azotonutricia ZAS-9]